MFLLVQAHNQASLNVLSLYYHCESSSMIALAGTTARAHKEERACNSIDIKILGVTKIDFKLHFQLNDQYEHLNAQCNIQPLHCDGRSFSYECRHRMQLASSPGRFFPFRSDGEKIRIYSPSDLKGKNQPGDEAKDAVYNAPSCTCSIQGGAAVVVHNAQHNGSICCSK